MSAFYKIRNVTTFALIFFYCRVLKMVYKFNTIRNALYPPGLVLICCPFLSVSN